MPFSTKTRRNERVILTSKTPEDVEKIKQEIKAFYALRPISFIYTFCASLFRQKANQPAFFINGEQIGLAKFQRLIISEILRPVPPDQTNATVVCVPRGYAKTSLCRALISWFVVYGYHRHILLVSKNQTKATESLNAIRTLLQSDKIVWTFGKQILDSGEEFDIENSSIKAVDNRTELVGIGGANGFRLQSLGYEQGARGSNWINERPSLILCDDIETEENTKTLERIDENAQVILSSFKDALPTDNSGQMVYLFTPVDEDCVGKRFLKPEMKDSWKQLELPAAWIEKRGRRLSLDYMTLKSAIMHGNLDAGEEIKLLFPEMQSLAMLKAKWRERIVAGRRAERGFAFDYLGVAPSGNGRLSADAFVPLDFKLSYKKTGERSGYLRVEKKRIDGSFESVYVEAVIGVDLAGAESKTNDETCLFPFLVDAQGNVYLLPYSSEKFGLYDDENGERQGWIDELFRIFDALGRSKTETFIEISGTQDHFLDLLKRKMKDKRISASDLRIGSFPPSNQKSKVNKIIDVVQPIVENPATNVFYPTSLLFNNKTFDFIKLQRQVQSLGNKTLGDDAIDALAIGLIGKNKAAFDRKMTYVSPNLTIENLIPEKEDLVFGRMIMKEEFDPLTK